MIRAVVTGVGGRMGGRVIALMAEVEGFELAGAVEAPGHPFVGQKVAEVLKVSKWEGVVVDDLTKVIPDADVVIDFTIAKAALNHLRIAHDNHKPMVIGTTGFSAAERQELEELAKGIPVVLSPNMSVGVNLMLKLLKDVATVLGDDYDVEIFETHHRMKRDAPSGTALRMAEVIAQASGRDLDKCAVYARRGDVGPRKPGEIGIQAIRAGDIVGEHTAIFAGLGERLEITHRCHSRDTFAKGALTAARWIIGKPNGLYDMQDVLGLK